YDFKMEKAKQNLKASAALAKRYGLTNLPKLPGTKTEVEAIATNLKSNGWSVDLFTEAAASEANFRKVKSPTVLHIATHGYYLKDVESEDKLFLGFETSSIKNNSLLRSGLILAGAGPSTQDSTNKDSENDGILTAYEASYLNLQSTELVVLSACQTGLGDEIGTEGVAGLQRSLTIAGAKNILMSLWPVDDLATQYLMTEFYKRYAVSRNVEDSFRSAQAMVKLKYPHPMYWAAFTLLKTFN
ncbi:MAG: CHAT domain-containing protein, partial [Bacteroidia bacterium]|nr:CHAT domain-containing protein [Bacteroidia bacterium]